MWAVLASYLWQQTTQCRAPPIQVDGGVCSGAPKATVGVRCSENQKGAQKPKKRCVPDRGHVIFDKCPGNDSQHMQELQAHTYQGRCLCNNERQLKTLHPSNVPGHLPVDTQTTETLSRPVTDHERRNHNQQIGATSSQTGDETLLMSATRVQSLDF